MTPVESDGIHAVAFQLVILAGTSGDTLHSAKHAVPAVVISAEMADSVRRELFSLPGPHDIKAAYLSVSIPPTFPPVHDIRIGADGTVWLHIGSPLAEEALWLAFDERGRALGTLRLPNRVELIASDEFGLWGLLESEEGTVAPTRLAIVR